AGMWLGAPGRYFPGWAREVTDDGLADAALDELRATGGGWVKIIGDWREGDARFPTFEPETLAGVVRRVHQAGGRVAIHAILAETVEMAVAAGCDSIEHGTFAAEAMVGAMADR